MVVTGDSQEEVMIFRYTHTLHHNIYIIIIIAIIITIASINIIMAFQQITTRYIPSS